MGRPKKTPEAVDTSKMSDEQVVTHLVAAMEKQLGKGIIMTNRSEFPDIERLSTGSISIDQAIGGGYPRGRIIEIYGPESCIYRDSWLSYEVWSADDKERINHKGGTIGRLYERFHNITLDHLPAQGRHLQTKKAVKFYIKSVNDEGSIVRNEVLDVVQTGQKECCQIATEDGPGLVATPEHKFLTPEGYKPLSEVQIGDIVFIHNNTRRQGRKHYPNRPETYVKYHPHWPTKVVYDKKTGNDYLYYRGQTARAAYEAFMNGMSLHHYINVLNQQSKEKIDKLWFLPENIHIHHRDENFTNNEISNLQLVDPSEHGRLHAKDRHANLSFVMTPSKIVMKEAVGLRETYDLKCAAPYNNYIAEGIVVHNSGKTTLALHAIAEAQKKGLRCAFVDAEHALDVHYAEALGVNLDKILISQPDSAESVLDAVDFMVRSKEVQLIVVDSVAALTPQAELENEMGAASVGRQAQLMSKAMRKLNGITFNNNVIVIFINQVRMKIGVMFGSPETTSGGNALKFYASVRLDIRRIGTVKTGEEKTGNNIRVKVVKCKVAPPFREAEFNITFGQGIDWADDLLNVAVKKGLIKKSGAWFSYKDEHIGQGSAKAAASIRDTEGLADELRSLVLGVKKEETGETQ